MNNFFKPHFTLLLLSLFVFGCKSKKGIVTKKKDKTVVVTDRRTKPTETVEIEDNEDSNLSKPISSTEAYIAQFNAIAMSEMKQSKIPASITLAQGILESGSGKGRLSVEANNHFGIKCHGWKGKKIYHDDDRRQECFRKYDNPETSYKDHSEFLTSRGRYSNLFKLKPNDYRAWAKGLRAAGYATDRKYPQKLISLIERYELYKYDDLVLGNTEENPIAKSISHKVVKGDTLYSISKRYGVSIAEIQSLNNLEDTSIALGQILIIKK